MKKDIYDFIGFEEEIKKEDINKDIEKIGKKGLYIFKAEGKVRKGMGESKKKKKSAWIR